MKNSKVKSIVMALATLCISMMFTHVARGVEGPRLMGRVVISTEAILKLYLRHASDLTEGASCFIGDSAAEVLATQSISESTTPPRTLFVVENSDSISERMLYKIKDALSQVVDNHIAGESFRVCLVSSEAVYLSENFSNNYISVKNTIDGIDLESKDARVIDVLYGIVDELEQDAYRGYTRIVVVSEGMDNKSASLTIKELDSELSHAAFPLYAIGINGDEDANAPNLERLFATARQTGGDCISIDEESDIQGLVSILSADKDLTEFTVQIPQSQQHGETTPVRLTLTDGTALTCNVKMPFREDLIDSKAGSGDDQSHIQTPIEEDSQEFSSAITLVVVVCAVAAGLTLMTVLFTRGKHKAERDESKVTHKPTLQSGSAPAFKSYEPALKVVSPDSETIKVMEQESGPDGVTVKADSEKQRFRIVVSDINSASRVFQATFSNKVTIGRAKDRGLQITDDETIGRCQCTITAQDGSFILRDDATTNHTMVNGVLQEGRDSTVITSGSTISMGRSEYRIDLTSE